MTSYLDSPDLPFSLHFADTESARVAAAARSWIARGQIFTVALTGDTGENRYLLVNFGAVSCLTVHNTDTRDQSQEQRITYGASLTPDDDLEIETRALSAHLS